MGRIFGKYICGAVVQETPSGVTNGTNVTFTLANTPAAASTIVFAVNGLVQVYNTNFTVSGSTITLDVAPDTGSTVWAQYLKTN